MRETTEAMASMRARTKAALSRTIEKAPPPKEDAPKEDAPKEPEKK